MITRLLHGGAHSAQAQQVEPCGLHTGGAALLGQTAGKSQSPV